EEAVAAETVENTPVAEEVVEQAEIVQDTVADEADEKPEAEGVVQTEVAPNPTNEDEADGQVDLEEIFERLSEHTENLIERERKLPFYEKFWFHVKNVLGFHFKIRWFYILCFCGIYGIIALYNNRFDIVRKAPFMNVVYRSLGIKAKIPGEGLEFQNVNWEYFDDEGGRRFEIKGFVNNTTDRNVVIPVIHIEFLDKETNLLQSLNRNLNSKEIDASAKLPLEFIIQNPAPTAKYIYMTFIDKY
ncbi:MAG: hypothetical protein MJ210_02515, partial [Alphaproteobacteria bacterium]|nr:hypothetical protein [Alphaproteobacteria bacterium]